VKASKIAPPLPLGTRVVYTHRAIPVKREVETRHHDSSGSILEQGWEERVPLDHGQPQWGSRAPTPESYLAAFMPRDERGYRKQPKHRPPRIRMGLPRVEEMDRWVIVWPESGRGVVTGLAYKQMGKWYYEEDAGRYLEHYDRFPLYEVKRTIVARPVLVPVFACMPEDDFFDTQRRFLRRVA
jgi:hypothetical protein